MQRKGPAGKGPVGGKPQARPTQPAQPPQPRGETLRGPLAGFGSGGIFPGRMEEIPIREIIEQEINKILNGVSIK